MTDIFASIALPSLAEMDEIDARAVVAKTEAQDHKKIRAKCTSLHEFIKQAWHVLLPETHYAEGWHIKLLCAHLEAITRGKMLAQGLDNRLLANVPPGSMKSLLVMVFWPAWEWGPCGMVHLQYIATSYRHDYCVRDSLRFRKLVMSDWFQRLWPVTLTKINEMKIENERGGFRETVPFTSLLGGRADRLLIDDPHSIEGTESEPDRERAIRQFRETAVLRLNDPKTSAIVIIMQRLHLRDLSGVIEELQLPYVHVMLPMRFEPERACETPFGRDPRKTDGELLFPERFPSSVVDRDEKAMTAYAIASQFQQRPAPRGGLIFKRHWFALVPAAPGECRRVRGWDLAASQTETSAYTVGLLLAFDAKLRHYYVEHVVRERVTNPEMLITRIAASDGKNVEISLPQDPGAAGKIQARSLAAALSGYKVRVSPESGDKVQRATPVAAQAEIGNMSIVQGPWNEAFLNELETFPSGYQDQVDALSRAFAHFIGGPRPGVVMPMIETKAIHHFGDYPSDTSRPWLGEQL